MKAAITEGYRRCNEDLVKDSLASGYDIQISGCACILMIQKDRKIWVSHAGDSRLVVGKVGSPEIILATEDHKPTNPGEKQRLEERGSAVVAFEYEDGQVSISRVFVKGTDYPGLCMSRSLGDQSVKDHGVTAEPDVVEFDIPGSIPGERYFIVLASDGVWEFISSKLVITSLSKKLATESIAKGVDRIIIESKKRWNQSEGNYCDDITAMLITI
jgi:serine/threonine protein phosphatase PrpC